MSARPTRRAGMMPFIALLVIALLAVLALAQESAGLTSEDSKAFLDNPSTFLSNPANAAKLPDAIKAINAMNDADMAAFGKKLFANYGTLPQNAKDAINGMMLDAGFDMTATKNKAFAAECLTTQGVDDKVGAKFIETVTRTGANAGLKFSIDASTSGAKPTMKALPDGSYVVSAGERQFVLGPQPPGRSLVYTKEGTENVLRIVDGEFGLLLPNGETRADSSYSTGLRVKLPGDDRLILVDPTTAAKIGRQGDNVVVVGQAGQRLVVPKGGDVRSLNGVVRVSRTGGAEPYAVQLFEKDQKNPVTLTVPAGGTFSSRSIGEGTSVTGQLSEVSYVSKLGPVSIKSETTRDTGVWIGNGIRMPRDTNGVAMDGIAINTGAVDAQNPPIAFAGEVKGTLTLAEGKEKPRTISYNGNVPGMVVGVDKGVNGMRYPILETGDLTVFKQASMSKDNGILSEALKQRLGLTEQQLAGLEGKDLDKKIKDNIKTAEKALKDAKKALSKIPSGKDAEGDITAGPKGMKAAQEVRLAEAVLKEAKALQVQVAASGGKQYVASGEAFQIVMQDPEKIHYDVIKMNYDERGGGIAGGTLKPLVVSSTIGPLTAADGFTVEYNGYTSDGKPVKSLSYNGAALAYNERGSDGQFLQSENVGMLRLQGTRSEGGSVTYAIDRSQLLSAGAQGLLGGGERLSMLERMGAGAITSGMAPLATLTPTAQGIDLTLQTKLGLPSIVESKIGGLLFSNDGKLGSAVNSVLENLGLADPTITNTVKDALSAGQPALAAYAKANGVPDSISLSVTPVPSQQPTAADNKNLKDAIARIWAATSKSGYLGTVNLDPATFDSVMKNPPDNIKNDVALLKKWAVESVQVGVTLSATKDGKTQTITPQGTVALPPGAYDEFLNSMKEGVLGTNFYKLTIPSDPATQLQQGVVDSLVEKRDELAAAVGAGVDVPATAAVKPKTPGATTPSTPPAAAPGSAPGSAPSSPPATPPSTPTASAPSGTVSAPATSPAGVYVDVPQFTGSTGVATGVSTTPTDSLTVDYVAKRVGIFPTDISSIEPAPKIRTSDPQYYVAKSYSGGSEVWYYFSQQPDGSWKFKRQETH